MPRPLSRCYRSAEFTPHETSVHLLETGNAVKDIPPQVKVIALPDDPAILVERQPGRPVHGRIRELLKRHRHLQVHQDDRPFAGQRDNIHPQASAAAGQAQAHRLERVDPLDPLDGVLKDDLRMVVGKEVRPVRLSVRVVGFRLQLTDLIQAELACVAAGIIVTWAIGHVILAIPAGCPADRNRGLCYLHYSAEAVPDAR